MADDVWRVGVIGHTGRGDWGHAIDELWMNQAAAIVNVQVGFAPLRPAEFVIVTLSLCPLPSSQGRGMERTFADMV